jgi:hypothetical protein
MRRVRLSAHPTAARWAAAWSLTVEVRLARHARVLELGYRLAGAIASLRLPAAATPAFADRLWEHTCFEAFVGATGATGYREFNFSPSGEWATYAFSAYRERDPRATAEGDWSTPDMRWARGDDTLALDVAITLDHLDRRLEPPLRLGLAAVIETSDGARSYWALRHPAEAPDFHHPESFAVQLDRHGASPPVGGAR